MPNEMEQIFYTIRTLKTPTDGLRFHSNLAYATQETIVQNDQSYLWKLTKEDGCWRVSPSTNTNLFWSISPDA